MRSAVFQSALPIGLSGFGYTEKLTPVVRGQDLFLDVGGEGCKFKLGFHPGVDVGRFDDFARLVASVVKAGVPGVAIH